MAGQRRRQFLMAGAAGLGYLAGCQGPSGTESSNAGTDPTDESPTEAPDGDDDSLESLELTVESLADGFTSPVDVAVPRSGEYYVADQAGVVERFEPEGDPETVLDIRDRMVDVGGYDERGLLGLAFHPEYDGNGRLFVRYSAPRRAGTPSNSGWKASPRRPRSS